MPHRAMRTALVIHLLISTTACAVWRPYTPPPEPGHLPDRVRLHLRSGETAAMDVVALEGDSVWVGFTGDGRPIRVPSTRVVSVEESRTHPMAVPLGVGAVAVGIALAVWAAAYGNAGGG